MPPTRPERVERRYPTRPLLGVGAILFTRDLGELLVVERGAPPAIGRWTFPGGLVEAGERAREACAREVREETGLERFELVDVALVAERMIFDDDGRLEYHYVILDFWGRAERAEPRPGSDARSARWVSTHELAALPTTRGVPEAAARALALARGQRRDDPLDGE